jgi:hypothetical protein
LTTPSVPVKSPDREVMDSRLAYNIKRISIYSKQKEKERLPLAVRPYNQAPRL